MKVLNVCVNIDPISGGGTAERTLMMTKHQLERGAKASILCTDIGIERIASDLRRQILIHVLPILSHRVFLPRISKAVFLKVLKAFEVDVVHLMSHWSILNAMSYLICRFRTIPYVVCPAGSLKIFGRSRIMKHLYNAAIGRRMILNAACCIAITSDEAAQFAQYGVDPKRVVVIPNGIDPSNYIAADVEPFRRKFSLGNEPFILFMGRLNLIKGADLLIEAYCKTKDINKKYRLVFAGPDEGLKDKILQMAVQHGVASRVHLLGFLGPEDKSRAYHAAELLVIPSRQEAMSIVVLEAGVCGTPVLLTDQCGLNDLMSISAGWVVEANVDALQKGLSQMLDDPISLAMMGANLRRFVEERYLWSSVINQYEDLYDQLVNS